ncbi:hypothetical protein J889_4281 [Acinetobacter baumannii 44327_6]|nr:hypothetical protein J889_4281 [Acinetobacter baumannii 44327_6]
MNTTNAFPKTIYAIQHLAFEDLGSLEDVFYQLGFRVRYFEAGVDDLEKINRWSIAINIKKKISIQIVNT